MNNSYCIYHSLTTFLIIYDGGGGGGGAPIKLDRRPD